MTPRIYPHSSPSSAIAVLSSINRLPKSISLLRTLQSSANPPDRIILANFPEPPSSTSSDFDVPKEQFVLIAQVVVFPGDANSKWRSLAGSVNIYTSLDKYTEKQSSPKSIIPDAIKEEAKETIRLFLQYICTNIFPATATITEDSVSPKDADDYIAKQTKFGLGDNYTNLEKEEESNPAILFQSVHHRVVAVLQELGVVQWSNVWRKYVFPVASAEYLSSRIPALPEGLYTHDVRREDLEYVLSKSSIPRTVEQMSKLHGVGLYTKEGDTIVAWCFESVDGSFISLWVEPEYRGKGLAKIVALELRKRCVELFTSKDGGKGNDGWGGMWCHADVGEDNVSSKAVMVGIGGQRTWELSWMGIDLEACRKLVSYAEANDVRPRLYEGSKVGSV